MNRSLDSVQIQPSIILADTCSSSQLLGSRLEATQAVDDLELSLGSGSFCAMKPAQLRC